MFSSRITTNVSRHIFCKSGQLHKVKRGCVRPKSTSAGKVDIEGLLREPSWSVRQTLFPEKASKNPVLINKEQLYHLLRLSALPAPASLEEESKMIRNLEAQLRFVQTVQEVNTEGIEPLQMIRDESKEAERINTITMDALKEEFEKEEVVGTRGRIRKKNMKKELEAQVKTDKWDPLRHASRRQGAYFIVNTQKG